MVLVMCAVGLTMSITSIYISSISLLPGPTCQLKKGANGYA